jgi:hypothetical protein
MAVLFGDAVAGAGISSAVGSATTFASRVMGNAVSMIVAAMKKAQAMAKFMWAKTAKLRESLQRKFYWAKSFVAKMARFSKSMQMMWKAVPIIVVFAGIILIFTNALFYVVLAVAYIAISIIQIIHFIMALPPFIWFSFAIFYYFVIDIVPFFIYVMFWLIVIFGIMLLCGLLIVINLATKGGVAKILLCDNSPTSWYNVPSYQHGNKYLRGVFCRKPCRAGYKPEEPTSTYCMKQSKTVPAYCPQANVMRVYTGVAKNNDVPAHTDYGVKGNLKYLSKQPQYREEILLKHFLERIDYLERCQNPTNTYSLKKYDAVTKTICANLDVMKDSMSKKDYARLSKACSQSFCSARSSYPFCSTMSSASELDLAALIKKIIYATISLIVFCVGVTIILRELEHA